jgi:predicted enzyme related to lactoylglutathione lyase
MYAIEEELKGQNRVTLDVADPARSHEFYQDLFGLVLREPGSSSQRMLVAPATEPDVAIVLRQRHTDGPGPVWLSVEVGSVSEVLDLYLLGIMMGAKAHLPRKRGPRWTTVITDPDGHRICVWTRVAADEAQGASGSLRPVRWEWRLAQESDVVDDGDVERTNRRSSLLDDGDGVPGRRAAGPDRVDRSRARNGGFRTYPAAECDRTLEGKE